MSLVVSDTLAMLRRWLIHAKRDVMSFTIGLLQPLFWLFLFGKVFGSFAGQRAQMLQDLGGVSNYVSYYASGVVAFTLLTNAVLGGIPIVFDRENGFIDKILSAPISRVSIVASRFIYVTGYSLLQGFLILTIAWLWGVRFQGGVSPLLALPVIAIYMTLLAAGFTALSLALAFVAPAHHVFFTITGFFLTPLLFLSSAFVPISSLPDGWRHVALMNPLTHAIDPMRALICGEASVQNHPDYLLHAAVLVAFDVACFALAVRVIRARLD